MTGYKHKVHYYETDKMGIVHHSNYIRWMEEARVDFLDKIGWKSEEKEKKEEKLKKKTVEQPKNISKKEKEKLENLIIQKEIEMEKLLERQDYAGYGIMQKEVEKLMEDYEKL